MQRAADLQVLPDRTGAPLTPAQKRFNTLLRQIERARQALAAWQEGGQAFRQAHAELLQPVQAELLAVRRQWAFALDALLAQKTWTRAERATMQELVCEAAGQLLAFRGDDAELKALFDKHAEVDFDTGQREAMLAMKDLAERMTGLDLGDDDAIEDEQDLMARMRQGLKERAAEEEEARARKSVRHRKTAAQARREAEEEQARLSVREIFRKLASALHPDRETDEAARAEKTALMQRVNQAYEAKDLLALLELQLQIEQIDAAHIASASAQRLKHYNKVLAEQLEELQTEVARLEAGFRMEFDLRPDLGLDPRRLGEVLERTRRHWLAELSEQQREMRILSDPAATRRWLKRQKQRLREAQFEVGFGRF